MRWFKKILSWCWLQKTPEERITSCIHAMRWYEFEHYVGTVFKRMGYDRVIITARHGPDGGKDLVIHHQNQRYLVQCKHWSEDLIGVSLLREFYAVMVENGAHGGYFVTLLGFTQPAMDYVKNKPIRLVSMDTLVHWHRMIETQRSTITALYITDPKAPRCGAGVMMVSRQSMHGEYWGCGEWPDCICKNNAINAKASTVGMTNIEI